MSQELEQGATALRVGRIHKGEVAHSQHSFPASAKPSSCEKQTLGQELGYRGGWAALAQLWSLSGPLLNQTQKEP